jgi:Ca-activated chloride channel family protein
MRYRFLSLLVAGGLITGLAACSTGGSKVGGNSPDISVNSPDLNGSGADPGDCTVVDMAVSSEKIAVLTELANNFNGSDDAKLASGCAFVKIAKKASGAAAQLLVEGWPDPEANGPQPVVWSPAASGWGGIVNERSKKSITGTGTPFMLTPLVIAMPKPMADALGYPAKPVGFADIAKLANSAEGWAAFGHPEWGPFRLGKTNPNFSTSGLNFTIAEYYAATGKTSGLTREDLARADVREFVGNVESSVVHYGDITMTFLNNWFRADTRGTALTYASAVAIEEKSVIDYNAGNPDGVIDPGEEPRPPKVPLVAIYPSEGTLFSDNPFFILNADWVSPEEQTAAKAFETFVQRPENQTKVLSFGFRPGNPQVAVAAPIVAANGVDPNQPQAELEVPSPSVLTGVLDAWANDRKAARVLLVLDVSGSMGDSAGGNTTKLELAQQAASSALNLFKDDDEVGLWEFSTDLGPAQDQEYLERLPVARIGDQREKMQSIISGFFPTNGTPLYSVSQAAHDAMKASYDPTKINAVVFLTDGVNDDGETADDQDQLAALIGSLRSGTEGGGSTPVRVFTISYGDGADKATLKRIAEATNAAAYDATNPKTINEVLTAVVSNF